MNAPEIPVSWGELIDKITILELKLEHLPEGIARENVRRELALLGGRAATPPCDIGALRDELLSINRTLWNVEDRLRRKEAQQEFDAEFIALARSVYRTNDRRHLLKKRLNALVDSELVEEKHYCPY